MTSSVTKKLDIKSLEHESGSDNGWPLNGNEEEDDLKSDFDLSKDQEECCGPNGRYLQRQAGETRLRLACYNKLCFDFYLLLVVQYSSS